MSTFRIKKASAPTDAFFASLEDDERALLDETSFRRMMAIERKRTERTGEPFLLMLVERHESGKSDLLERVAQLLLTAGRDTDLTGWYSPKAVGMLFTGLPDSERGPLLEAIAARVDRAFHRALPEVEIAGLSVSFHFFPDDWKLNSTTEQSDTALYPDLKNLERNRRSMLATKRAMDIAGSALGLIALSPFLLAIAIAIKLSSKGPVLFKQQRVGQYGRCFSFLKFRSMRTGNDPRIHQQYVRRLIENPEDETLKSEDGVYKITRDPRVTRVGGLLRRTSLDELPQLWNVLRGEMSLVGPRPAIPYELEAYQTWHRRRLLEAKPGMTGLWQVVGRSQVSFDEMVRLDLRYAMHWSPALDLKILWRTPLAVLRGKGAY